jgi:hypothetical protein
VTYVLSKKGWTNLAEHYYYSKTFSGERIGIISASINGITYQNSIILKYNQEGMYLKTILLFRGFHKPILIPWKEIIEVRPKKILFLNFQELIVGNPFVATIMLKDSTYRKMAVYLIR